MRRQGAGETWAHSRHGEPQNNMNAKSSFLNDIESVAARPTPDAPGASVYVTKSCEIATQKSLFRGSSSFVAALLPREHLGRWISLKTRTGKKLGRRVHGGFRGIACEARQCQAPDCDPNHQTFKHVLSFFWVTSQDDCRIRRTPFGHSSAFSHSVSPTPQSFISFQGETASVWNPQSISLESLERPQIMPD
jgi:hypothetical protein